MSQIVTIDEMRHLINCLYDTVGVRLRVDDDVALDAPTPNNFQEYCQAVQRQLELPVRVVPEFVSHPGPFPGLPGRSVDVSTQVMMPDNLPAYGSEAMRDFPIAMKVNLGNPDPCYVLTQLSIALSQVYLHSRRDPLKDSPVAVSLCAMMMGFTPYWRRGRSTVTKDRKLRFPFVETTKVTTRQGVLSDEEYEAAESYIEQLQNLASMAREGLKARLEKIRGMCAKSDGKIDELQTLVATLTDGEQPRRIKSRDAELLGRLSRPHTIPDLKSALEAEKKLTNDTVRPMRTLHSYTRADVEAITLMSATLDDVMPRLNTLDTEVSSYIAAAKRSCRGFLSRLFGR